MKSRVAFFHGYENAATGRTNFSASRQRSFDSRTITTEIDNLRGKLNQTARRCGSQQFDRVFGCDRARSVIFA